MEGLTKSRRTLSGRPREKEREREEDWCVSRSAGDDFFFFFSFFNINFSRRKRGTGWFLIANKDTGRKGRGAVHACVCRRVAPRCAAARVCLKEKKSAPGKETTINKHKIYFLNL